MKETMKDIILNASADMTESCHRYLWQVKTTG